MKKLILALALSVVSMTAFAAEKGEMYFAPVLGYHIFDGDHELDNSIEGGLRLGYFHEGGWAGEIEADYTTADYDKGGDDEGVTSLSLHAVKFCSKFETVKPYAFIGLGGLFSDENMGALVAGVGARIKATDFISFDLRVKDMLLSKDTRNDIIPSLSINYHFGNEGYKAPAKKEAPAAAKNERKDSDGDGVVDADDICPNTPKGSSVNAAGCVQDSDGDGVTDIADKCAGTPEGYPVDANGCTPDSDGDGVFDFEDKCPNTMKGVKVNSAGCFKSVTLEINFNTNSAKIDTNYLDKVEAFAGFLNANSHINVEVQGHTDSKGSAAYNKLLSQKRAESVVKMLTKKYGVDAGRLTAKGYGDEMPIAPNDTPENMLKNRRIDTVVK
jgi:OOP family OmpA-OmpF porin